MSETAEARTFMDAELQARRARRAVFIGALMLVAGLMLVLTRFIIYVGAWPDERPVYLAGIGVVLVFMGTITFVAGVVLSYLSGHETNKRIDAEGR
jgi:cytochrome c biogenesis protein CcdA